MTDETQPLIIFTPSGKRGRFAKGTPVLDAARALGVDLDSVCGGRGICSRCQITPSFGSFPKHGLTVTDAAISPWNPVEERYRQKRGLLDGRRLGCQARIEGDLIIDVPPESQVHRQLVRKDADARPIACDPAIRLCHIEVAPPDIDQPRGDFERLCDALASDWQIPAPTASLRLLGKLQRILRQGDWAVTCAIHTDGGETRLLDLWPGLHTGPLWGLAIDLGSTTIAAHLTDLQTGAVHTAAGMMNPQIRFGEDLMSRVSYAMLNEQGVAEMTRAVREALTSLARDIAKEAGIAPEDILEAVIVANPVMHHLLLGFDPTELGQAPFALTAGDAQRRAASELDFALHPDARLYILPLIAGHVGADCAAVALAEAPQTQEAIQLIVDVGTNAELILGNSAQLLACSSPTGPAFEGAQISAGQRAAQGAIERVRIDPETREPRFRVIGSELWSDAPGFADSLGPQGITGICGSGIIEAVAEMRIAGILDASGIIGGPDALGSDRLEADGRTFSYRLSDRVAVTQGDVRAIQLAKSALYAGAKLLMEAFGTDHVDRVTLAGAFGAHISPRHAMVLGMIPDCPLDQVRGAGNAAGTGARIALVNRAARAEIEALVRQIHKVETATEPRFQEHFVAANHIPNATDPFTGLRTAQPLPEPDFNMRAERGGRRRPRR